MAVAAPAGAQEVEDLRLRMNLYLQEGRGYQSTWGPLLGPGSEDTIIVEPQASLRIRQSDTVTHTIDATVDVVSAASTDGVDLISEASRVNEAGTLDVTSRYQNGETEHAFRYGLHLEEHFRSAFAGSGLVASFAEDNSQLLVSGNLVIDSFDPLDIRGRDSGTTTRVSANFNAGWSQVLSRTTVAEISYGVTYQAGTLETSSSSVPAVRAPDEIGSYPYRRIVEELPDYRWRHAAAIGVAQHLPVTHSTLKGGYRFYVDDFGLMAHTAEVSAYQYLVPFLYLRGSYRLHQQDGVDFYTELAPAERRGDSPRSADSDLAPFTAREIGVQLGWLRTRGPAALRGDDSVDLSYFYYFRNNDLDVHFTSLGYARTF